MLFTHYLRKVLHSDLPNAAVKSATFGSFFDLALRYHVFVPDEILPPRMMLMRAPKKLLQFPQIQTY